MSDERFHEQELDRFWDEVVRSPSLPVAGEFDLYGTDQQLIRQFQARGAVSPPDAVRERVRRGVLSSIGLEHLSKERPVNQTAVLDVSRPAAGPTAGPTPPNSALATPALPRRPPPLAYRPAHDGQRWSSSRCSGSTSSSTMTTARRFNRRRRP